MRQLISLFLLLAVAVPAMPKTDIQIDPDYDPRVDLRVVVLPAQKARALRRVSERTISAMFATELLALYEVLDLMRFEAALEEHRFTLDDAFTVAARQTVRDNAGVDAIASVEIFRWEEGTPGLPFLSAKSGVIGARLRMMDPYTGRLYWSVNRLDKVKPGTDFLDRATDLFRDVMVELDEELQDRIEDLNDADSYSEYLVSRGDWPGLQAMTMWEDRQGERAFLPRLTPEAALLEAYRGYGYLYDGSDIESARRSAAAYEDLERDGVQVPRSNQASVPPAQSSSQPPLRGMRPDELPTSADSLGSGSHDGLTGDSSRPLRPGSRAVNELAPTLPPLDYLDAPSDSTSASSDGYETTE